MSRVRRRHENSQGEFQPWTPSSGSGAAANSLSAMDPIVSEFTTGDALFLQEYEQGGLEELFHGASLLEKVAGAQPGPPRKL